jgi:hypothetical protein
VQVRIDRHPLVALHFVPSFFSRRLFDRDHRSTSSNLPFISAFISEPRHCDRQSCAPSRSPPRGESRPRLGREATSCSQCLRYLRSLISKRNNLRRCRAVRDLIDHEARRGSRPRGARSHARCFFYANRPFSPSQVCMNQDFSSVELPPSETRPRLSSTDKRTSRARRTGA